MKAATDSEIENEIRSLLATFEALSSESNTNAVIVTMIASGILTIGRVMAEAYSTVPWGGSVSLWLGELISAAGELPALMPSMTNIASTIVFLFVQLKE